MQQTQLPSWKPRSFQKAGVILGIKQACAGFLFPPGGGKTSTMYMIFRILKDKGFVKRMLVICPIRPMYNVWPNQKDSYAEFTHLTVEVLHGKDKHQAMKSEADIHVINPDGLQWFLSAANMAWIKKHYDVLCVDESTKFKNTQTTRFKLLKKVIPMFKRRYILTGTPTPQGLMDLFGQVYILDEGQALGRYITHYRNNYFFPSGFGGYDWSLQPGAEERIAERVAPLTLRVDLKDIGADLPELVHNDIWVSLPPDARKTYDAMEEQMMLQIEEDPLVAANAAVASSKCRQIANGAVIDTDKAVWYPVHNEKLDALTDLMEQLQGQPLLITYEFKFDRDRIAERLKVPCISTGDAKHDSKYIKLFAEGKLPAVMGNPQSIALGIDGLQNHCNNIAMIGVTWSLQNYQQVILRVQRQGSSSKRVFLHRILARNTVDERAIRVLDAREAHQEDFMQMLKSMRGSRPS